MKALVACDREAFYASEIEARDHRDKNRSVGPLSIPKDAIVMDTTHLTQDQVVDKIVGTVRSGQKR